jgi:nitrous oxidase accessory protein
MVKKIVLAAWLVSSLLVIMFAVVAGMSVSASLSIIHVPDDYPTIQEAVDAADLGDIVFVSAGTYYEHVTVNKTVSLVGESRETTIIDGNRTGDVLYVTADDVKISGFTIRNGGGFGNALACGIILDRCNGNIMHANTIASNLGKGIWLNRSSGNMIINNHILNNGDGVPGLLYGEGVMLDYSNGNMISNNLISSNVVLGIILCSSDDNIVNHNTFTDNLDGVGIDSSTRNVVSDNVITLNGNGISVEGSAENTVEHNQISENEIGIGMGRSKMNVVKENNITENTIHGIAIAETSTKITVIGNVISKNLNGIKIHYSNGSTIHHNNFTNNTRNAPKDVYPNVNTWDDGYPSGGNYWSDYNGTDSDNGPYQNITGNDGIGDTPHTLDTLNKDSFPLMAPISFFDAGAWNGTSHQIHVVSNSTISNFHLNKTERTVKFNVTDPDYTVGFCRVTIPNIIIQHLWQNNYTVLVDGNPPLTTNNWTDNTYTYIYFTYLHSEHEVVIIPEFPTALILMPFLTITLYTIILRRKNLESLATLSIWVRR